MLKSLVSIVFFGNLFYGICALSLCVETNVQHGLPLNGPHFYFLVFSGTVAFYSRIYYKSRRSKHADERTFWYQKHQQKIKFFYLILLLLISADIVLLALRQHTSLVSLKPLHWFILLLFPFIAFLYSFKFLPFAGINQLRTIGWLKPFFIGFAWAGLVTVYPVLFRQMQSGILAEQVRLPSFPFWLQNFLFISLLAILFDVKDHLPDKTLQLNTYPAIIGINKTLSLVVIPLSLLSAGILLLHGFYQQTGVLPLVIQMIPYVLLWYALTRLRHTSGILFYLVAIDGLMLAKGLCGILSTLV